MTTTPMTPGTTYEVTYRPTIYGKPVTRVVTLTEVIVSGYSGKPTYIFHGKRGGKLVLGPAELVTVAKATA